MKMRNKAHTISHLITIVTICLLVFAASGQLFNLAEANFFPIPIPQPAFLIKSDGALDPPTAPISIDGNVYTFSDNIAGYTVAVERDNIILDGNGYTLKGNGNSTGIFIKNLSHVVVRNMKISGFDYGIRLFAEDFMSAVSSNNTLSDNMLTDNEYGIFISSSSNNVLRNNIMYNNTYNFWIKGGYISEAQTGYINDIDDSNMVDCKPIIYWVNEQDKIVTSEAGFVGLINCTNVLVQNLTLSNNAQGILIVTTNNSKIIKNFITNTGSGIYLFNSSNITIEENSIVSSGEGIRGQYSSDNSISSNNITRNNSGIYFTGTSVNNLILNNIIAENTVDGLNLWDSSNTRLIRNKILFNTETGINFFGSHNNIISSNILSNTTGPAIKFWYHTSENVISENNITSNNIGILINDSYDNIITHNVIEANTEWGMRFEGDQNNNIIHHNCFINNRPTGDGLQVSVTGVGFLSVSKPGGGNLWDNGTIGNYWSDYLIKYSNASEIADSGIGDTAFVINENNIDRYPSINQIIIPEFPASMFVCVLLLVFSVIIIFARKAYYGLNKS